MTKKTNFERVERLVSALEKYCADKETFVKQPRNGAFIDIHKSLMRPYVEGEINESTYHRMKERIEVLDKEKIGSEACLHSKFIDFVLLWYS